MRNKQPTRVAGALAVAVAVAPFPFILSLNVVVLLFVIQTERLQLCVMVKESCAIP